MDGLVAEQCEIQMADGLAVVLAGELDLSLDEMVHASVGSLAELVDAGLGVGDEAFAGEYEGGSEGGVAVAGAGPGNQVPDVVLPAVGLFHRDDLDEPAEDGGVVLIVGEDHLVEYLLDTPDPLLAVLVGIRALEIPPQ